MKLLRGKKYIVYLIISLVILTLSPLPAISQQNIDASKESINWDVWPYNHWPEADPKPGDPHYVEPSQLPDFSQPEGLTDEELRKVDPHGYKILKELDGKFESEKIRLNKEFYKDLGVDFVPGKPFTEDEIQVVENAIKNQQAGSYNSGVITPLAITYVGYLTFTLVPSTDPTYSYNGYIGYLYFRYGYYDYYWGLWKTYTVRYIARSGNNKPSSQSIANVGPIPVYTWKFGFVYEVWQGYVPDTSVEFNPGKWRLDPWTGAPYGRSYFCVHGGPWRVTLGCIRLHSPTVTIPQLKWYYDYRMDNKKDYGTARLTVYY